MVIVGAGTAGCVLAGRLADDPRRSILLLEAGPDGASPAVRGDSFFAALAEPGRTYPDVMVQRTRGAELTPYLLGRGVGGSSAVNGMVATIGVREDYNHWERDLGCVGWAYKDVAGSAGRMSLTAFASDTQALGPVDQAFIRAAKAFKHPKIKTPFIDLGVGPAALSRWKGERRSAAGWFLDKMRKHSNLTVRAEAQVARVVLDGRRAVGVELSDGELIEAGEVVLACGALQSPVLLLRSGVERSGIGVGLKDHPSATLTLRLINRADTRQVAAAALLRWSSPDHVGDLQALSMNHVGDPDYGALVIGLMSVYSSGSIELVGDQPVIAFNMLDDERDVVRLREATRHVGTIANSKPFWPVADAILIDGAGTPLDALNDDGFIDGWMRANVGAYVHAACSCRMGPIDDPTTAVDTSGLVHEYTGLRVCDASIFPDIPSANLAMPTMIVADRIAQLIIDET